MTDHWRGHPIEKDEHGYYRYADTKQYVWKAADRPCGHCGKSNTPEGHDGCLGELPCTLNACCGHGETESAYIVLWTGDRLAGQDALDWAHGVGELCGQQCDHESPCILPRGHSGTLTPRSSIRRSTTATQKRTR